MTRSSQIGVCVCVGGVKVLIVVLWPENNNFVDLLKTDDFCLLRSRNRFFQNIFYDQISEKRSSMQNLNMFSHRDSDCVSGIFVWTK